MEAAPVPADPGRTSWRAALALGIVLTCIAYMVTWERGFYLDDYSNRTQVVNVVTGEHAPIWRPSSIPGFPVRFMAWALNRQLCLWQTDYEFALRLGCAALCALNAFLLGWLLQRILNSPLTSLTGGLLLLSPFFAFEAVLWIGAVSYVATLTLVLAAFHCFVSALRAEKPAPLWGYAASGVALFFSTILFFEQPLFTLIAFPFLSCAWVLRTGAAAKRATARTLMICVALVVAAGAYGAAYYRGSGMVDRRGGLDLTPAHVMERVSGYFDRAIWMTHGQWGSMLKREVWNNGRWLLMASGAGVALLITAFVALAVTAVRLAPRAGPRDRWGRTIGVFLCLALAGASAYALTLALPGTLVSGQILEYRMLLFPHLGACLMFASVAWLIDSVLSGATRGVSLGAAGVARFVCVMSIGLLALHDSICMLGFGDGLARRHQLDLAQRDAIVEGLPSEALPDDALLVTLATDGKLYGQDDVMSTLLFGAFEATWCAKAILGEAYRRDDLEFRALNRWVGMTFSQEQTSTGEHALSINGAPAPLARTIPVLLEGPRAQFIERLAITTSDGRDVYYEFPAVMALPRTASRVSIAVFDGKPTFHPKVIRPSVAAEIAHGE